MLDTRSRVSKFNIPPQSLAEHAGQFFGSFHLNRRQLKCNLRMQRWPHGQILHTRLVLKLDLQRELNNSPEGVGVSECRWISGGLYDTESIYVATATGDGTSENVAVEGIQEIGAEQNVGSFGESGPLIEAEIFVEITLSHRARAEPEVLFNLSTRRRRRNYESQNHRGKPARPEKLRNFLITAHHLGLVELRGGMAESLAEELFAGSST